MWKKRYWSIYSADYDHRHPKDNDLLRLWLLYNSTMSNVETTHDDNFPPAPYPWPERPSSHLGKLNLPEEIPLSPEQNASVRDFEADLYERMEGTIDFGTKIDQHTLYLDAFESDRGRRILAFVYGEVSFWEKTEAELEGSSRSEKQEYYRKLMEDLTDAASDPDSFEQHIQSRRDIELSILPSKDLEQLVVDCDLASVPEEVRKLMNQYSSVVSRNNLIRQIRDEFQHGDGDVSNILNPNRISIVVNPEELADHLEQLREFKGQLRDLQSKTRGLELTEEELEARITIISLYRRYINYQIQKNYPFGRLIGRLRSRNDDEERVLSLLSPGLRQDGSRRFDQQTASKTIQRIDRMLYGVGLRVDDNGSIRYSAFTDEIDNAGKEKLQQLQTNSNEVEEDDRKFGAEYVVQLGNDILESLGFETWEFVVDMTAKGVKVRAKRTGEGKKDNVVIPESYSRGSKAVVRTVASELGHLWRIEVKREVFGDGLKILSRLYTGQVGILGEGLDKYFANKLTGEVFGDSKKDEAMPYAYGVLTKKSLEGLSFKEAVVHAIELRAQRAGMTLAQYLEKKSDRELEKAVKGTTRYWRRFTPFDETSSYLTDTSQLSYIEGELITSILLESEDLWPLAFVSGIDLYTACQLSRLGELDLSQIKRPDFEAIAAHMRELLPSRAPHQ